ncbi:LTA synthase family protein [Bdellovibrio sp. HCB209]|uniref:LTA synthase family protein n=1 Tax=Bdellovibrio sp. HCB209 TaxID=3394354 RepID=UPI0039B4CC68
MSKFKYSFLWFAFVFVYFIYEVHRRENALPFEWTIQNLSLVALSLALIFFALDSFFVLFRSRPKLMFSLTAVFTYAYCMLGYYHHRTIQVFDFAIVADHWKSILRPGTFGHSMGVVNALFSFPHYFWSGVGAAIAVLAVRADLKRPQAQRKAWVLVPALGIFAVMMSHVYAPVDEFSSFSKTVMWRVVSQRTAFQMKYKPQSSKEFPLIRTFNSVHSRAGEQQPNVFIIFVESFNGHFAESKSRNGKEYTPFFNQLIKQGLYFERFYSQSIQTGRAHFASLCGVTPSLYGKDFVEFVDRNFNCLPQILKNNGYDTIFSKANFDVNFDNTHEFTTKNGYDVMNSLGGPCEKEAPGDCWGWGIRDDIFYKRFFAQLEQQHNGKPLFGTLATISSHVPHDDVPVKDRKIWPNPQGRRQQYANAIRITDEYLETFFGELKKSVYADNSVVFVLGDHSIPMGEHDNYFIENLAFEENFRTPMLVLDFRKNPVIKPGREKEAYSQLNLAATVLDLAGISTHTHFVGDSLLAKAPEYIPMVQPYGGIYFSVIGYPYKYMLFERTGKEYLFDLSQDPKEQTNLLEYGESPVSLEGFRKEVGRVWRNYDLVVADKVWPREKEAFFSQVTHADNEQ